MRAQTTTLRPTDSHPALEILVPFKRSYAHWLCSACPACCMRAECVWQLTAGAMPAGLTRYYSARLAHATGDLTLLLIE
jgi:hypothetical protein